MYKRQRRRVAHCEWGAIVDSFKVTPSGKMMVSQFIAAALAAHPEMELEICGGLFGRLLTWLGKNIYRHGAKYTANELLLRVTGQPLTIAPYLAYLRTKYSGIYRPLYK